MADPGGAPLDAESKATTGYGSGCVAGPCSWGFGVRMVLAIMRDMSVFTSEEITS